MTSPAMDERRRNGRAGVSRERLGSWALGVLASALAARIALDVVRLVGLRGVEADLEGLVAMARQAPERVFGDLKSVRGDPRAGPRHRERCEEIMRDSLNGLAASSAIDVRWDGEVWTKGRDQALDHEEGAGGTLSIATPPGFDMVLVNGRPVTRDGAGDEARWLVRYPENEIPAMLDLVGIVDLGDGTNLKASIRHKVAVRRFRCGLGVELRVDGITVAGASSTSSATSEGFAVVPSPSSAELVFNAVEGIAAVSWICGERNGEMAIATDPSRRVIRLPDGFPWIDASARRRVTLVVFGRSPSGTERSVSFRLDARGVDYDPVRSVSVNSRPVVGDTRVRVAASRVVVTVELEKDFVAGDDELKVLLDGHEVQTTPREGSQLAQTDLAEDGESRLTIEFGRRTLRRFVIVRDSKPPILVTISPDGTDRVAADSTYAFEIGQEFQVRITDDGTVAEEAVEVLAPGCRLVERTAAGSGVLLRLRAESAGDSRLRITAADDVGNRAQLDAGLVVREVFRVSHAELFGVVSLPDGTAVVGESLQLVLRSNREGRALVRVTSGPGMQPVFESEVAFGSRETVTVPLEVLVAPGLREQRIVQVSPYDGPAIPFVVDRQSPRIRVLSSVTRVGDDEVILRGADPIVVEVVDDVGLAPEGIGIEGAVFERTSGSPERRLVEARLDPAVARVVVTARDRVGNRSVFAMPVKEPVAPTLVEVLAAGMPVDQEKGATIRQLSDLEVRVSGLEIVKVQVGGEDVSPVPPHGGRLPPLGRVPVNPRLVVRVRDSAGSLSELQVPLGFESCPVLPAWRSELEAVRVGETSLRDPRLELLERRVRESMAAYLLTDEATAFIASIGAIRATGTGAATSSRDVSESGSSRTRTVRSTPEDRGPSIRNSVDGAELLRVRGASETGVDRDLYVYAREVTIESFLAFAASTSKDDGRWWQSLGERRLPGLHPIGLGSVRRRAGELAHRVEREPRAVPMIGFDGPLSLAYAAWSAPGVPEGELRLPTLSEWQLAAGRGLYPSAAYPTTGASPSGAGLTTGSDGAEWGRAVGSPLREGGLHPAGAYGLLDMAGSVWEIVRDDAGKFLVIGGCAYSRLRADCSLDGAQTLERVSGQPSGVVGLRLVWTPSP